jgi:hypothetical protein
MKPAYSTVIRRAGLLLVAILSVTSLMEHAQGALTTKRTVSRMLSELQVKAESAKIRYSRDLYPHWVDRDGDGCDARREVLLEESRNGALDCHSRIGLWMSVYDGVEMLDRYVIEVDHVVALAEAHRSGADRWSANRRELFANDLDSPWTLVAVTAASNQQKSDHDAVSWRPATAEGRCFLARATVITKWRWRLSVDRAELTMLRMMLRSCAPLSVIVTRAP